MIISKKSFQKSQVAFQVKALVLAEACCEAWSLFLSHSWAHHYFTGELNGITPSRNEKLPRK